MIVGNGGSAACGEMRIGDLVTYNGRPCSVRGFDPMSVTNACVYLEDATTGEPLKVPLDHLHRDDLLWALVRRVAHVRDALDT